jgi:hypothetical protein
MKQIIVHRSDLGITGTGFMPFPAQGAPTSAEVHVESVWMVDGTFRNLRVEIDTAPGGGKSWVFVVRINGVDSAMTVTIADSATVGTDTSNDIAVSEGDVLTLKCTGSGTPAVSVIHKIAVEFEGDNAGESGYNGTPASVNEGGRLLGHAYQQLARHVQHDAHRRASRQHRADARRHHRLRLPPESERGWWHEGLPALLLQSVGGLSKYLRQAGRGGEHRQYGLAH